MRSLLPGFILLVSAIPLKAQDTDPVKNERFSVHAQTTIINQFKPAFTAKYSGQNSLLTKEESKTSITSTLFLGARLWKGAGIFLNPEIAGGSGLSQALGIAAATNGETFRIGSPDPKIYLARLFYRQIFALGNETTYQESDINDLGGTMPSKYFSVVIGKICAADYFDNNLYSHDPRTQFMSWALMSNGAWDYPANTRGYTPSVVLEYVTPRHEIRYGLSLMPVVANGLEMNWHLSRSGSSTLEYTRRHTMFNRPGAIRLLAFFTKAHMGNYRKSIEVNPSAPVIADTRSDGNTKYGFGINAEQALGKYTGCFFRASWNDGKNETWAFTEIDRSISLGLSIQGGRWKRDHDNLGVAYVTSGISSPHRDYLKAGGKGFMLGDGNLQYAWEHLAEFYYSAELKEGLYLTGTYQLVVNPGYNQSRQGPVSVVSVRVHVEI